MRGSGSYEEEADFEYNLCKKMKGELDKRLLTIESKNKQLESTAENMRLSILGKDSKTKDDKPLEVVNTYVQENTTELVDPLDVQKKIDEMQVNIPASRNRDSGVVETNIPDTETAFYWLDCYS